MDITQLPNRLGFSTLEENSNAEGTKTSATTTTSSTPAPASSTATTPSKGAKIALMIPPIAGIGAGLYYAHSKKATFWEYVGYAILGHLLGHSISQPFQPTTGLKINGKEVVLPFYVKAIPAIGFIGGVGYAMKGNKGFWAHFGYGILGSIIGGIVSLPFAMASNKPAPAPAGTGKAGTGTSTGTPSTEEKLAYEKALSVGKKMGGDPKNMPTLDVFVGKYRAMDATGKKIFSEYMDSAEKIDYTDIDKAFGEMGKIAQDLSAKYGDDKVKSVLA